MDLSGYPDVKLPDGTMLYDKTNKKVVGKMSDEKPGEIISQVVALKPKMYSVKTQSYWFPSTDPFGEEKKAKGIPKVAKKRLSHADCALFVPQMCPNRKKAKIWSKTAQKQLIWPVLELFSIIFHQI